MLFDGDGVQPLNIVDFLPNPGGEILDHRSALDTAKDEVPSAIDLMPLIAGSKGRDPGDVDDRQNRTISPGPKTFQNPPRPSKSPLVPKEAAKFRAW